MPVRRGWVGDKQAVPKHVATCEPPTCYPPLAVSRWHSLQNRMVLPRQGTSSRRTALLSRPDGSGEPSYVTNFLAGVIWSFTVRKHWDSGRQHEESWT